MYTDKRQNKYTYALCLSKEEVLCREEAAYKYATSVRKTPDRLQGIEN